MSVVVCTAKSYQTAYSSPGRPQGFLYNMLEHSSLELQSSDDILFFSRLDQLCRRHHTVMLII